MLAKQATAARKAAEFAIAETSKSDNAGAEAEATATFSTTEARETQMRTTEAELIALCEEAEAHLEQAQAHEKADVAHVHTCQLRVVQAESQVNVNDTQLAVCRLQVEHYLSMTPAERAILKRARARLNAAKLSGNDSVIREMEGKVLELEAAERADADSVARVFHFAGNVFSFIICTCRCSSSDGVVFERSRVQATFGKARIGRNQRTSISWGGTCRTHYFFCNLERTVLPHVHVFFLRALLHP